MNRRNFVRLLTLGSAASAVLSKLPRPVPQTPRQIARIVITNSGSGYDMDNPPRWGFYGGDSFTSAKVEFE